jgi:hypothetical protein
VTIGGDDGEMPLCSQNAREEALHERELGASLVGCVCEITKEYMIVNL